MFWEKYIEKEDSSLRLNAIEEITWPHPFISFCLPGFHQTILLIQKFYHDGYLLQTETIESWFTVNDIFLRWFLIMVMLLVLYIRFIFMYVWWFDGVDDGFCNVMVSLVLWRNNEPQCTTIYWILYNRIIYKSIWDGHHSLFSTLNINTFMDGTHIRLKYNIENVERNLCKHEISLSVH